MKSIIQIGKGMRLAFTLFAMLALALTSAAQKPYRYDNGHKYSLWSNLEIGVGGMYSYSLQPTHHKNFGADLRITKRIGDFWRVRGIAEVNGFLNNGFDRFGKALVGISFDALPFALPFYTFFDYGAAYNPSSESKFGLAMDGGIGLQFKVGSGAFFTEAAVDRVNNGMKWQSNASVRLGYLASLGITEQDRQNIEIDRNVREGYGTLKQENQLLKANEQKITQANEQLQATLDRATAALELATQRLSNCQAEVQQVTDNCGKAALIPIRFDYASAQIPYWEISNMEYIANYIKTNEGNYKIEGYSSPDGNDYNNQKLSGDRAFSVYQMLTEVFGISKDRLIPMANGVTTQYGEDSELNRCVIVSKSKY
jgi:outer membrane protein OmpA-like peptidoglycan-associated protein